LEDSLEKYGSGIKRIQEGFVKYGLEKPYFEELQGGFLASIYRNVKE
jgi:predicted HTH transcriptional regulator